MKKAKNFAPNKVINLKESHQLLADVMRGDGVDLYKQNPHTYRADIVTTKSSIDSVLREHFGRRFDELDSLSLQELQDIRTSFLQHYKKSCEGSETLKKWTPLNQLVGYTETLVASAYMQLNAQIDRDLSRQDDSSTSKTPLEHTRIQILNALKKGNQGKSDDEIQKEVTDCVTKTGRTFDRSLFDQWRTLFEQINTPLQENYAEHMQFMNVNEQIRDLRFREQKQSELVSSQNFSVTPSHEMRETA